MKIPKRMSLRVYDQLEKAKLKSFLQLLDKKAYLNAQDLKRLLLDESNKRVLTKSGLSLNGKGIVNTAIALVNNRENIDRYRVFVKRPQTKAGFSFALDFSASMNTYDIDLARKGLPPITRYERLLYVIASAIKTLTPLGIDSVVGAVGFENVSLKVFNTNFLPTSPLQTYFYPIKKRNEKYLDVESALYLLPNGNTFLISYALASIHMAKQLRDCNKRVAMYLTDGEDEFCLPYLKSIECQAEAEGIKLILVVLNCALTQETVDAYLNSGVRTVILKEPEDFISMLVKELEKLF